MPIFSAIQKIPTRRQSERPRAAVAHLNVRQTKFPAMKRTLTSQEVEVYGALKQLAGSAGKITGRRLRDAEFAKQVVAIYGADVAYPESLQSRKLQILRDKEWLKMERHNGGTYTLLE